MASAIWLFIADVFEEFFSPVNAAQTLLFTSATKRDKVLEYTMAFVKAGLESGKLTAPEMTGILHIVGAIADILIGVRHRISQQLIAYF